VYSGGSTDGFDWDVIILPDDRFYGVYGYNYGDYFDIYGMFVGQGSSNNGSYTASVTDYFYAGDTYPASITASYVGGTSISGTYVESGIGTFDFWGSAMPSSLFDFNTPANLSHVTGLWTGVLFDGSIATVTVYSNGTFTGSDSGCSYSGTISPDPTKNFFNVSLTFGGSPCLQPGQSASGIGLEFLLSDGVTRQLLVGISSGSFGSVFAATR
jgi:hypothetical protein